MLIGTVLFAAVDSPPAHGASTGIICIIPGGGSSCPSSPAPIIGTVGTRLRVSVFIQNSTSLNGFDVTLLADHTILRPAGADLTGTVLPGPPTLLVECLSGILVTGATCSSTDSLDTLHLAASATPGGITTSPTTGLLFTAIYNITATTTGTSLGFQTGCGSPTAPTSHPPLCVTVANGTPTPVPEAVQTAIFSTSTTPDFVMLVNPSSITITAGSSAASTLSITSVNSFSGTVSLTATVSPATLPISLSPTNVTLAAGQTVSSTITISTSTSTPSTTYVITVTGTSGSLSHAVTVTVMVNPSPQPDFAVTSSPNNLTLPAGSTGTSTITLVSLNGFAGTINLAASVSPSGPTASMSASSVTLSAGMAGTVALTVSTTSSTLAGSYIVTVTGVSGALSHSTGVSVMVTAVSQPDFSIGPTGVSIGITQGLTALQPITLTSLGGFAGTVSLTDSVSPTGLSPSLSPTSITLASGGTGNSTLTIPTTSSTPPGSYTITVTGTSGSLSHAITIPVTVFSNQPDFTISANPSSLSVSAGASATSTINIGAVNGFNSNVLLTVSTSNGLTGTISPTSVAPNGQATLTVTSNTAGSYTAQVTGTSGSLSHTTTVTVTVTSSSIGVVCIIPSGTTSCPSGTATITGTAGTQIRVSIFIQGSSALDAFDITLLADHNILKPAGIDLTGTVLMGTPIIVVECLSGILVAGSTCSVTDTVDTIHLAATSALGSPLTTPPTTGLLFTAIYNITGTTSGIPLGFQTGCSNTSVSPNVCVTIANGTPTPDTETAPAAVFSNSGPAPDFTITVSLASLTIARGSCDASSAVTLASINGFSGTITLTTTVSSAGLTATLSSATATLSPGGIATIALTICTGALTPSGSYAITVTATSGSITHTAVVTVNVPATDFTVSAIPSSLTIQKGSQTNSTIAVSILTLASLNGFSGTISISASITPKAPHPPTVSLSSTSLTLSSGGTATVFLTVAAGKNTSTGSYTVTVTFTSGSITHTVTINVVVTK